MTTINKPKGMLALGRLKAGAQNKTELAYEEFLKRLVQAGQVAWFKFEGVKLRLADNTFYTPDYAVMLTNGQMEMHEVKGARAIFQDDAKVKVKVAAEIYPFRFLVAYPPTKKNGGAWEFDSYS